jgi:hypothetical protein
VARSLITSGSTIVSSLAMCLEPISNSTRSRPIAIVPAFGASSVPICAHASSFVRPASTAQMINRDGW